MKCPLDYHLPSVFSIQRFTSFPLQYYQYKEKRLKNKIHNTFKRALSDICLIRLRKKCPYSELFWSAFSHIRTEYGEILRISPYSVQMRENADQKNYEYGHFLRSVRQKNLTSYCHIRPKVCIKYIQHLFQKTKKCQTVIYIYICLCNIKIT